MQPPCQACLPRELSRPVTAGKGPALTGTRGLHAATPGCRCSRHGRGDRSAKGSTTVHGHIASGVCGQVLGPQSVCAQHPLPSWGSEQRPRGKTPASARLLPPRPRHGPARCSPIWSNACDNPRSRCLTSRSPRAPHSFPPLRLCWGRFSWGPFLPFFLSFPAVSESPSSRAISPSVASETSL